MMRAGDIFDRSTPEPNTGCWLWLGAVHHGTGLPRMPRSAAGRTAHVAAYEAKHGVSIGARKTIHTCGVRLCVNPDHVALAPEGKTQHTCARCGKTYRAYNRQQAASRRFCSLACKRANHRGEGNPNWRGGKLKRHCESCGEPFEITPGALNHRTSVYCSIACKAKGTSFYPTKRIAKRECQRRRETRERAGRKIKTHTFAEWEALCAKHKHRCAICKKRRRLTRDHIVPLTKGGHDGIENIQPACHSCNARKGDRLWLLC